METPSPGIDFRFSSDCVRLLEPVHTLITTRSHEFKLAGQELDSHYSVDACLTRAWADRPSTRNPSAREMDRLDIVNERLRRLDARCNGKRATAWRTEVLAQAMMKTAAEAASASTPDRAEWKSRARRFGEGLQDFVEELLPDQHGAPPEGASWAWAAKVLLMFWLTCEPRAEDAVLVSDFQEWEWLGTATEQGRFRARYGVLPEDGTRFIEAVETALRVAAFGVSGPEHEDKPATTSAAVVGASTVGTGQRSIPALTEKERAVLMLLLKLRPGEGLTGKEILTRLEAQRVLGTTQSDLTTRIIPMLRTFCTIDSRTGVGYSIPECDVTLLGQMLNAAGQSTGNDAATAGQTS